ncbi:MAG: class I SAM-dependent methyltransferase [Verrucomicrobiota bacterium]
MNGPQLWTRFRHALADALGRPVDYEPFEFQRRKEQIDWARIPELRTALIADLFEVSGNEVRTWVAEAEALEVREKENGWFDGVGTPMGRTDRITLYAIVRAARPERAVETGAGAGSASFYILSAMARNKTGRLISIDRSDRPEQVGALIPPELKPRMEILIGTSEALLPRLDGPFDLFLHDSSHTHASMTREFEWAHTQGFHVICSHDVLMSNAWTHFLQRHRLKRHGVVKNLGVAIAGSRAR